MKRDVFSKKINRKSKNFKRFQINQTNSNLSPCCTAPISVSPHFIMQCGMMCRAQAAKVLWCIRSAFCQRHPVVYQRCLDIPTLCHAHLTERMPCQLYRTDRMPCSSMVIALCALGHGRSDYNPCQLSSGAPGRTGHPSGSGSRETCRTLMVFWACALSPLLPGNRKALTGFPLQRLRCCVLFLWTVLFNLSSIIISRRKHLCNHFSRNIVEHS